MALRRRHATGIPSASIAGVWRFLPATLLITIGLSLLAFKDNSRDARHDQDLITKEGTLSNYSFKKTAEGEKDYGIWLRELSERLALPSHQQQTFDTAAFQRLVKPGDRVQVQYNRRENMGDTEGTRTLYGLAVPSLEKTYFSGEETIQENKNNWLAWLSYGFIAAGAILFIYKLVQLKRERTTA